MGGGGKEEKEREREREREGSKAVMSVVMREKKVVFLSQIAVSGRL